MNYCAVVVVLVVVVEVVEEEVEEEEEEEEERGTRNRYRFRVNTTVFFVERRPIVLVRATPKVPKCPAIIEGLI
jgi:hypothetical protein